MAWKTFCKKVFLWIRKERYGTKSVSSCWIVSSKNILPLLCYVTKDQSCSLFMEPMDSGIFIHCLLKRMEDNETLDAPFELLEVVDIMLQSCLYQKCVVHRDLKSMNILVECDEHERHVYAKVADFGLSKRKESSCTYTKLMMDWGTT
jgi:serine/threonine protein kinase